MLKLFKGRTWWHFAAKLEAHEEPSLVSRINPVLNSRPGHHGFWHRNLFAPER